MTTTFLNPVTLPYIGHVYTNAGVFKKTVKILNHPSLSWAVNSTGFSITLEMAAADSAPFTTQGDLFKITEDGGDGSVLYTGIVEDFPDSIDQTVDHQIGLAPIGVELADELFNHNYTALTDVAQMIRDAVAICTNCTATTSTVPDTAIMRIFNFADKRPIDVLQAAAKMAGPTYVWFVDEIGQVWFGPSGLIGFTNTDFETQGDWVLGGIGSGIATISTAGGDPHSGTAALRITNPSASNYGAAYNKKGIPVSGLVNLPISAYIKGSAGGVIGPIRITFANPGSVVSSDGIANAQPSNQPATSQVDWSPTITNTYAWYSQVVAVPAGYAWAFIECYNNGTGTVPALVIDDIAPSAGKIYSVRTRVDAPVRKITAPITNQKNYIKGYGAVPTNATDPIVAIYDQTSGSPIGTRALDPVKFPNLTDQNTLQSIVNTIGSVLNRPLTTIVLKLPFHNNNGVGERINLARVGGAVVRYFEPLLDDISETDPGLGTYSQVYMIVQVDVDGPEQTITARSVALNIDDFVNEINDNSDRVANDSPTPVSLPVTPGNIVGSTPGGPNTPATPGWSFPNWSTGIDNIAQVNNAYVIVKWTPNPANNNIAQYEIRYSKNADGNYYTEIGVTGLVDGGGRAYKKIAGLVQGQSYTFEVRAINNLGIASAWSTTQAQVTATDSTGPATPTGIVAGTTPRGAIVTWNPNSEADIQGYKVQVSIGGAAYIDAFPGTMRSTILTYVAPTGTPYGTSLQFKVQAVDNSNNASAFSSASASINTDSINNPDLLAGVITADKIAANAVTAQKLESVLILASLIKAGTGVQHIEMDQTGFRAYDATGNLVINMPNDGTDVTILARIIASSLAVSGSSVFRGSLNELAISATLQLDSVQTDPSQAASLGQGWDLTNTIPVDSTVDGTISNRNGLSYSTAGGAGGATKVFYQGTYNNVNGHRYLAEILASNRTLNRSIDFGTTGAGIVYGAWLMSGILFVAYSAGGNFQVNRYTASTLAGLNTIGPVMPVSPPASPQMCTDGTNIYIVDTSGGALKWNKYDSNMTQVGSTVTGGSVGGTLLAAAAGNFDFGAFRIAAMIADGTVRLFDSSGTEQTNDQFPFTSVAGFSGIDYGDALGDGARFWTFIYPSPIIVKHSNWKWTTASPVYWVGYTWYDGNATGGTHETKMGPHASITMGKRKYLTITASAIPGAGGVDDPNNIRFYMINSASDPGTGGYKLQSTQSAISYVASDYNSGGAADPGANGFPAGTPAILKSQIGATDIKGDGTSHFGQGIWIPKSLSGTDYPGSDRGSVASKIDQIITTSGQVNPAFTSIPQDFTHLQVFWVARDNSAGTTFASLLLRLNNISTASYYQEYNIEGGAANTPTESLAATSGFIGHAVQGGAADANAVGRGRIFIPNYTDGFKKIVLFEGGMRYGTGGNTGKWVSGEFGFDSTAAITELDFILTFVAGCKLTLHGIP